MTTRITLSTTQYDILEHAIDQTNGQIVWFPDNVKGGARHKVIQGLFNKALITRDGQDNYFVAAEGYVALGRDLPVPATTHPDSEVEAAVSAAEANWAQEKQAAAQRLLKVGVEGNHRRTRPAKGIQHHIARSTRIADGPFHQFHRLHGRVQIILLRLLDLPDVALVTITAPVAIGTLGPAVENWLVLTLIVGTPQGESVLGPDDEGGPVATGGTECCLQTVEFA